MTALYAEYMAREAPTASIKESEVYTQDDYKSLPKLIEFIELQYRLPK